MEDITVTTKDIGTNHSPQNSDLLDRITLIETMMQEARRGTEYRGWVFVLWGAAYIIAIVWGSSRYSHPFTWPITMIAAILISVLVASIKKRKQAQTPMSRSITAIWQSVGAALFIFCFAVSWSGHAESHSFFAAVEVLLGVANCASSIILRWRVQFVVALLWWVSAVATCFVAVEHIVPILLGDAVVCLLGFGIYLMVCERRDRQQHAVQHG